MRTDVAIIKEQLYYGYHGDLDVVVKFKGGEESRCSIVTPPKIGKIFWLRLKHFSTKTLNTCDSSFESASFLLNGSRE
jgi:hypothetical protein